jgi:hypothetical protein
VRGKDSAENAEKLPVLLAKDGTSFVDWSRKVVGFFELLTGTELNGRQLLSGVNISVARKALLLLLSNEQFWRWLLKALGYLISIAYHLVSHFPCNMYAIVSRAFQISSALE